jgi:hypothetical protein
LRSSETTLVSSRNTSDQAIQGSVAKTPELEELQSRSLPLSYQQAAQQCSRCRLSISDIRR